MYRQALQSILRTTSVPLLRIRTVIKQILNEFMKASINKLIKIECEDKFTKKKKVYEKKKFTKKSLRKKVYEKKVYEKKKSLRKKSLRKKFFNLRKNKC